MGEADSKKQREKVKDRFVVVLVAHAVRVTILLCQVSEGLEDSEKVQSTTQGSSGVLHNIEGLVKTAKKSSR